MSHPTTEPPGPSSSSTQALITCDNFIQGKYQPSSSSNHYLPVISPVDNTQVGNVCISNAADVDMAVACAQGAFPGWSGLTMKARASIMFRFQHLMEIHAEELAQLVVRENGKNIAEARASVAKGNETVEWACGLPQMAQGKILQVSRGVTCSDMREPIGVVASVSPLNFPIMCPMWTIPIALTAGNCVILKPSEKVPLTMHRVAALLHEAGVPPGVFQTVNGTAEAVNALIDHPGIAGVTFVGSSRVAELVANRATKLNKRVLAMGGAKNHLVALPDCEVESAASDIVASFAGCAGQRCMAATVLILVGKQPALLDAIVSKAKALAPGVAPGQVGAIIDAASQQRILEYISEAEKEGVKLLVDGRGWATSQKSGTWVGPTVLLHSNKEDKALKDEIFGPVLSVIEMQTWDEAIAYENANPHGNAACIYTTVGAHAAYFETRFRAGMIGVNVGVPVPREPFSFGGLFGTQSKYGCMVDITGEGCLEFVTNKRKITTKWAFPVGVGGNAAGGDLNGSGGGGVQGHQLQQQQQQQQHAPDRASFVGAM